MWRRRRESICARALLALAALALASCAELAPKAPPPEPSAAELAAQAKDGATSAAPSASQPDATSAANGPDDGASPSEIIKGNGDLVGRSMPHAADTAVAEDGGITLNFVNADVRDVAKAVLGDFLGVNFALGAGVQGTITVQTSKPLSRSEVLPVFEQILHINGLTLIRAGSVYKIVLNADASRESGATMSSSADLGSQMAGYGTQIVPLHYIAAPEMQRLLEPMEPSSAIVRADAGRNILIVQGTQQERQAVVDQVALFDVDWLSGMSFGLFTPKYTDARGLVHELSQIMGGTGGPLGGIVKLVPIERLNMVLAISPQTRYLKQIQHWVDRLDRPGVGSDRRIYVYAVQNGRASDLAAVLKKVLYGTNRRDNQRDAESSGDNPSDEGDQTSPPPSSTPSETPSGAPSTPATNTPTSEAATSQLNQSLIGDNDSSETPSGRETITADEANNAIVVYGTPQEYSVIENALQQLDSAPLQVLLEAAIAEVTLNNQLQYGVQYFYQPSNKHQFVLSDSNSANISSMFPGFSYIFSEGSNIKIVLDALSQVTHVEVVSSPEVLVLNNHTATLQVGDQVPVATSQAVSVSAAQAPIVNTIAYQATGVILKVTPRVNQGGMVMMDVSQDVSDVSTTTTSTLDSPTITQRRIDSTIAVHDGETIALGGLIQNTKTISSNGLPYLSEIPVLGGLFGTKGDNGQKTELIVLITPHVVDNLQKARSVTDELRRKLPSLQTLLEK